MRWFTFALALAALFFCSGGNLNFPSERSRALPPLIFKLHRPLLSLSCAAALANKSTGELVQHLELGAIQFGFDLATPHANRRAIRILGRSLADYLEGRKPATVESAGELLAAINSIFPATATTFPTAALAGLLDCDSDLIMDLIRAGAIRTANQYRQGRGGAALITRQSCVEFVASRRIV